MVCFKKPREKVDLESIRSSLTTIHEVIEHHTGGSYLMTEPLLLAIGLRQTVTPNLEMKTDEWEDTCRDCGGWEWVDGEIAEVYESEGERRREGKRNEFGGMLSKAITLTGHVHVLIVDSIKREGRRISPEGSSGST